MDERKKSKKSLLKHFFYNYKIVISNEDTFEERLSFKLSKINVISILFSFSAVLIAFTVILVFYTSLREYVPGYSPPEFYETSKYLTKKTDSLEKALEINNRFYRSIENVLMGKSEKVISKDTISTKISESKKTGTNVSIVVEDSLLRDYVESEDRFNLTKNQLNIEKKTFYTPLRGKITQSFNFKENHFGLDISVKLGTAVRSISNGRVVFSEWSVDTGHVLIIDHGEKTLSVYKHNKKVLKKQNDLVRAGEIIAYSGDQGQLSSGPHLHLEIWINGAPINPELLINFD